MKTFILGRGGRLGTVLAETFRARGDEIVEQCSERNYVVCAQRYRGEPDYAMELEVGITMSIEAIDRAKWAKGDRAVVLVSSVCATDPAMNQPLGYNVSKAALNQVARFYAKKGLRVNTVSPDSFTTPDAKVSAQQVANVIAFLCSPEASGINGEDIRVCG